MRKDIYIVSVTGTDDVTHISQDGYTNIIDAIDFITNRIDNPIKDRYTLTWRSPVNVYEIHLIKVGD